MCGGFAIHRDVSRTFDDGLERIEHRDQLNGGIYVVAVIVSVPAPRDQDLIGTNHVVGYAVEVEKLRVLVAIP